MRILLTGHEGYLGAGLMRYFSTHHEVIGWGKQQDICTLNGSVVKDLKVQAVVNCAAVTERTTNRFEIGAESDRVNVGGIRAIVAALKDKDIKLIHISTKDVFGKVYSAADVTEEKSRYRLKFAVDDRQPFAPLTIYAKSKLISEFIAESHPQSAVIRLSSCYTDYYHHRGSWVVDIMRTLLQGKPVTATGNGKQCRDPLHVDDLGRLMELILKSDQWGIKLNAGGGTANITSILEYIRLINPAAKINAVPGDDYGFAFNNRLAGELFGWKPEISFAGRVPVIKENILAQRAAV
ncbi:MAG: NAD-dependent epimerase/dehydratase family protein [Dehalococcoidales bacterium]|nr:NAD-dependent epimerase/dehydratase family protein [Dehalococcoidales bacterium]